MTLDRRHAEGLDRRDPLAGFGDRFVFTAPERIYADGNSLGRLPLETVERMQSAVRDWGERLSAGGRIGSSSLSASATGSVR